MKALSELTDKEIVLQHLKEHGPITQKVASDKYGITRLGARIYDLKEDGEYIRKRTVKVSKRGGKEASVAEYYIEHKPVQADIFN
jgi:DNA-binding Lrp family transcriptional regulator